ncbi:hypothetical protein PENTCL1PPCAC_13482, partial [Pristionchus entomophagus]
MHCDFPHFIMLNSTIYAEAPCAFYAIRTIDVSVHLFDLMLVPFSCIAVIRAGVMHRNFRLQVCLADLYFVIGIISRFVILYYELNDIPFREDDCILNTAEILRLFALDYFCTIVFSLAIERMVATHFWSWYEKCSPSTLLVLLGVELLSLVPDLTLPFLSRAGIISHVYVFVFQVVAWTSSVLIFLRIYHVNVSLSKGMAKGAVLETYSVARTFQVRENIEVFRYMFSMVAPAAIVSLPAFLCFAFRAYGPHDWYLARHLVWASFDIFCALFGLAYLVSSIISNQRIYKEFLNIGIVSLLLSKCGREEALKVSKIRQILFLNFSNLLDEIPA